MQMGGYLQVYTEGPTTWHNTCLVARGFDQAFSIEYTETFPLKV